MMTYTKITRLATTVFLLTLTSCQITSVPLNQSISPSLGNRANQSTAVRQSGFRTTSLTDPFPLPFNTTEDQYQASLSFSNGNNESWNNINTLPHEFRLWRNSSGSLMLDTSMGRFSGPTS